MSESIGPRQNNLKFRSSFEPATANRSGQQESTLSLEAFVRIGPQSVPLSPASQASSVGRDRSTLDLFGSVFGDSTAGASQPLAIARFVPIIRESLLLTTASQRSLSDTALKSDPRPRIESLIDTIRRATANPLFSSEGIEGQQAEVDSALLEIGKLTGAEIRLGGPPGATISDFDASRIDSIDVLSLAPSGKLTIAGQVTQAAEAARIEIAGSAGAAFDSKTSLVISGERGSGTFNVNSGESFAEVAERITKAGGNIGVRARVVDNALVIESRDVGSAATLRVEQVQQAEQVSGTQQSVTGVNASQVQRFDVVSLAALSSATISGSVISSAAQASARYLGDSGAIVAGTATFRLTGDLGTADLAITAGEALSAVADRVNAVTDQTGVTAGVNGNDLEFNSEVASSSAAVQIEVLTLEESTSVSGIDPAQVINFNLVSIDTGASQTLAGQVTQTATAAELTLQVADAGVVADGATFELTGTSGTAQITIVAAESLTNVVDRINAETENTGVTASLVGDEIALASNDVGSDQSISATLLSIDHELTVTGVNAAQLDSFQVDSFTDGSSTTLNGTVTQVADIAELTFTGGLGLVGTNSTFTLSGSSGSAEISTTSLQGLGSLRDEINSHTETTGVTASLSGNTLTFNSTGVGTGATIAFDVTSGSFNTQGGNGDGTANGIDAEAVINGSTIAADGNDFQFTDAAGDYSFSVVQGFTGALDTIDIDSQAGQFAVTGGNGNGTADGTDATAEIDGQQLTGSGNHFAVTTAVGQFELDFAAGFTGTFDSIVIDSTVAEFELADVDLSGRAEGADAVAEINSVQVTGSGNEFSVAVSGSLFELEFVDGFTGTFDTIVAAEIEVVSNVSGGSSVETASGIDARATINGESRTGVGNRFRIAASGVEVDLTLADHFEGSLGQFTIGASAVVEADNDLESDPLRNALATAIAPLLEFGSGGVLSIGVGSASDASRAADQVLANLATLPIATDGKPSKAAFSAETQSAIDRAEVIADSFSKLSELDLGALRSAIDDQRLALHRQLIVDLLR